MSNWTRTYGSFYLLQNVSWPLFQGYSKGCTWRFIQKPYMRIIWEKEPKALKPPMRVWCQIFGMQSPTMQASVIDQAMPNGSKCLETSLRESAFPGPWHWKDQEAGVAASWETPYDLVFATTWIWCSFVRYVPSKQMLANGLTKVLRASKHFHLSQTWCATGTRGGQITRIVPQSLLLKGRFLIGLHLSERQL